MNRPTMVQLLSGGLDRDRRPELQAELASDPDALAQAALLLRDLDVPIHDPEGWRVPPAGAGFAMESVDLTMGLSSGHALRFMAQDPSRQVVVLWDQGGGWEPVFPNSPAEAITVGELPMDARGNRVLELILPHGRCRWAVLLPEQLTWPEPWLVLQEDLEFGRVPVSSVVVDR